jgi:hypothetical protein
VCDTSGGAWSSRKTGWREPRGFARQARQYIQYRELVDAGPGPVVKLATDAHELCGSAAMPRRSLVSTGSLINTDAGRVHCVTKRPPEMWVSSLPAH